jgi:hypothetical protein
VGEPLLEILTGESHVLAYTNPGTLYRIRPGDPVTIKYGMRTLRGWIEEVLPITAALPQEFQKAFRPKERAQVIRIAIEKTVDVPPVLTKIEVQSESLLKSRLAGLLEKLKTVVSMEGSEAKIAAKGNGVDAG